MKAWATSPLIAIVLVLLVPIPAYTQDLNSGLVEAAKNGEIERVQALLNAGADVNAKDNDGKTVLMWALDILGTNYANDTVKALLAADADVNAKDNDGRTALMWAAEKLPKMDGEIRKKNHADVVEMLKKAGAKE